MSGFKKPPPAQLMEYEKAKLDIECGWLGKFFGTGDQSTKTVSFMIVFLLIVIGCVMTGTKEWNEASNYWQLVFPIVTLFLGYLFGKSTK